jgi:hypothetical protein
MPFDSFFSPGVLSQQAPAAAFSLGSLINNRNSIEWQPPGELNHATSISTDRSGLGSAMVTAVQHLKRSAKWFQNEPLSIIARESFLCHGNGVPLLGQCGILCNA